MQRLVVHPSHIHPPRIDLTPEQQHYLSRVLRLRSGDRLIVLDGEGQSWVVGLRQSQDSGLFQAEILETVLAQTELPIPLTLVMALPKGSGFDEVVRQGTELGVSRIAPVISDRTLLHPSPQKLERWRRIAQEAAEQSERQFVPTIQEPISFQEHLQTLQSSDLSHAPHYLCVTRHSAPHLLNCLEPNIPGRDTINRVSTESLNTTPYSLTIAIGPEGGWTEHEVEGAIAVGYQPITLGDRILRTVTAPVVALSLIAAVLEK